MSAPVYWVIDWLESPAAGTARQHATVELPLSVPPHSRLIDVPIAALPPGAKEGDVLRVVVDAEETERRRRIAAEVHARLQRG